MKQRLKRMADDQSENSELRHRKVVEERDSGEQLSAKENASTTAENSEGVSVCDDLFCKVSFVV